MVIHPDLVVRPKRVGILGKKIPTIEMAISHVGCSIDYGGGVYYVATSLAHFPRES